MSIGRLLGATHPEHVVYIRRAEVAEAALVRRVAGTAGRVLSAPFRHLYNRLDRAYRRRAALHELRGLSDDILRDIGITRGDIHHVSRISGGEPPSPDAGAWVLRLGANEGPEATVPAAPLPPARRARRPARRRTPQPVAAPAITAPVEGEGAQS